MNNHLLNAQAHLLTSVSKCATIFIFKWGKNKIIREGDDRNPLVQN